MTGNPEQHVFVVDDELKVLEAVGESLGNLDAEVTLFVHSAECLERLRTQECDLLITDLKMPEMGGIELLARAKRLAPWMPVLLMADNCDIPTAVKAAKVGVECIILKSLNNMELVRKVESMLQKSASTYPLLGEPLTKTEMRILRLVIDGKNNRGIARFLKLSVRLVEVHRARMMEKLGMDNPCDLVKRVEAVRFLFPLTNKESHPHH